MLNQAASILGQMFASKWHPMIRAELHHFWQPLRQPEFPEESFQTMDLLKDLLDLFQNSGDQHDSGI